MQAVILAGGLSKRLGGVPKAGLVLEGQTLLARTVDAAAQAIANQALTHQEAIHQATVQGGRKQDVGNPAQVHLDQGSVGTRIAVVGTVENMAGWLETTKLGRTVLAVQEDPPFSGPAAGIGAGVAALVEDDGAVLVLACDMPHVGEIARLLAAELTTCEEGTGIMAVSDGKKQPLAAIYPLAALKVAVAAARGENRLKNASVFSLVASVNTKECAVPSGLTADIDTWEDARAQGIGAGPTNAEG